MAFHKINSDKANSFVARRRNRALKGRSSMKNQMKRHIRTLVIVLFPLLLSCATPGQFQRYTQGSIIDRGLYSITGPPGDGWLTKIQEKLLTFYRPITRSEDDQIVIVVVRNDFDEKKSRYSSEEELGQEFINGSEERLIKNAKESNCVTNDMKKGTTVIGDKKLHFISSTASGCTVGSFHRKKAQYMFFPSDFNERHSYYHFLLLQFRDKESPLEGLDLTLITPVIDSLKIKPQVEVEPKDAKTYYQMGLTHVQKQDFDQAINYFNKSIEMDPKNPWAYNDRGVAYVAKGKHDRAISNYTKALEIDPKNAAFYCNRAIAFCLKEQYDLAILDCNNALEIDPRHAGAIHERGVAYAKKGQHDQAISDYTKALEIDPKYAIKAYYNRGISYADKGQYDLAISDFNKALEINPKYADAYYNRGRSYYFKKEYNKSWDDVKKVQDLGYQVSSGFLEELRKASGREK
jgi:tetratricopeptide (TPR) repeat protein